MAEPIVLPKVGLTMEEGAVGQWLVAVGDTVAAGQVVVEIETYKATIELDTPIDGVLRAALDSGQTVPVGTIIGIVAGAEESIDHLELGALLAGVVERAQDLAPAPQAPGTPTLPAAPPASRARDEDAGRSVSPAARRRAHELGVELSVVEGTGPGGRVRVEDIERAAAERGAGGSGAA